MRGMRRRINRLLCEASDRNPARRTSTADDVVERELSKFCLWATTDEMSELIAIADREMLGEGDEARADAIHDAVEARFLQADPKWDSRSRAWTRGGRRATS